MYQVIAPAKPAKASIDANEVRMRTRPKPKGSGHFIEISIGRNVAGRLGWNDDKPRNVTIAWGIESALGKLKISPPDTGTKPARGMLNTVGARWIARPNKSSTCWKICTSALPETFSDEPFDQAVVFEVIPTAATEPAPFTVVTLPKGFHRRELP